MARLETDKHADLIIRAREVSQRLLEDGDTDIAELLQRLADELADIRRFEAQINEALNMGDGVYRP